MDKRVILPVPIEGILRMPTAALQGVLYYQDGVGVTDYMTTTEGKGQDECIDPGEEGALMIAVYRKGKWAYVIDPGIGFEYRHHYGGTEVLGAPGPKDWDPE